MIDIGIVVLAYSRPRHVAQVFQGIKALGANAFSVYIDGADDRLVREKQEQIVEEVRKIGWADVKLVRRSTNMGLRRSIVSAVTDELQIHEAVIVIEDDCVPLNGFLEYMYTCLTRFQHETHIRSLCGYQFPHVSDKFGPVKPVCISRFVPWGWATWRDRWADYETDLRHLLERAHETGIYGSLPNDVRKFLDSYAALDNTNDIWSINWVLAHYLSGTYCVFPSRPLVANIGFDGTGVHCFETDAFELSTNDRREIQRLAIDVKPVLDKKIDQQVVKYMERHWGKTMVGNASSPETSNEMVARAYIEQVVDDIVDAESILDIHTHLFPPQHEEFFLSGMDEILTYHYLFVEALTVTGFDPRKFFSFRKIEQAEFVWNALFRHRAPISEAARGVLTLLDFFGIKNGPRSYHRVRQEMEEVGYQEKDVLDRTGISRLVMTNDPFNEAEWSLFNRDDWDSDLYLSALRLDALFAERDRAATVMQSYGFTTESEESISEQLVYDFLSDMADASRPVYAAISVDGDDLGALTLDPIFRNVLVPWLKKRKMPLALMIGVKRGVNPTYGIGGDGFGGQGLESLEELVRSNPDLRFLVTHLHDSAQHAITVLALKFQNLTLFGFWWFMNQPNLIQQRLRLRMDLLGADFIAQHSDARVLEQLCYKWKHFKTILKGTMTERYTEIAGSGWPIDRDLIRSDVRKLLRGNAEVALNIGISPEGGSCG